MKTFKLSTLIIILMSMLMASCSNSNKSSIKQDETPIDSVKLFFEDAKAKNLLFSDMVKTDFIKNYIVNNYSKEFYNGILSNIRTDYDPVIKEDETGLYTEYNIQIVQSMI